MLARSDIMLLDGVVLATASRHTHASPYNRERSARRRVYCCCCVALSWYGLRAADGRRFGRLLYRLSG